MVVNFKHYIRTGKYLGLFIKSPPADAKESKECGSLNRIGAVQLFSCIPGIRKNPEKKKYFSQHRKEKFAGRVVENL